MSNIQYGTQERVPQLLEESKSMYGLKTYMSLFSSAGVGCYGFKLEGFHCIATVELLQKRLKVQEYNEKCFHKSGYICGDMTQKETKDKVFAELERWNKFYGVSRPDVIIATPPCQGMSVANHKKGDELKRNSLVVESIAMVSRILPKFFVFENVRAFLKSICTDEDGVDKPIGRAIGERLSGNYNILSKVVNFKDYGNPSSRTRTLVIGVRKDLPDVTPFDIFPDKSPERTLRQTIGHLPPLPVMGETSKDDIYHNFRPYSPRMVSWISSIKEGQSAFDNEDPENRPHTVKDGKVVLNTQKNGDKYTRQRWDKVAPCIYTRNDILASQNTVHPTDNRVFSIREVMLMMSVPDSFRWSEKPIEVLNAMSQEDRASFLKKEEMNIRQNLGEAVPTVVFRQIAKKIRCVLSKNEPKDKDLDCLIRRHGLASTDNLVEFISSRRSLGFPFLSRLAEMANSNKDENAAYYTRRDICYSIVSNLPEFDKNSTIEILEPSIGVGNFLPVLVKKYQSAKKVSIDVVDIDPKSITILRALLETLDIPENFTVNLLEGDFLLTSFDKSYDLVIGNPPYKKITNDKSLLTAYKAGCHNQDTNNIFSFFIEKALKLAKVVALIVPKSLISAPEFNKTRELLARHSISHLLDFGEMGFKGVKIETICFIADTQRKPSDTVIESLITNETHTVRQSYAGGQQGLPARLPFGEGRHDRQVSPTFWGEVLSQGVVLVRDPDRALATR